MKKWLQDLFLGTQMPVEILHNIFKTIIYEKQPTSRK